MSASAVGRSEAIDDNRVLGDQEIGGRAALPIFREIMLRAYRDQLVGPVPEFPPAIEGGIEDYLARCAAREPDREEPRPALDDGHLTASAKCITVLIQ